MIIDIYTLSSCKYCKEAKELMDKEGILYKEYVSENYPTTCARIEATVKSSYYPIVKLPTPTNPTFIISELTEEPRSTYSYIYYFKTIPHLIQQIKTYLHEK